MANKKAKNKQRAAYLRGYRDSMKDQDDFFSELERSLYAIALTIETSSVFSADNVLHKINRLRSTIDEYRDENYGGMEPNNIILSNRKMTIIDLQADDNTFLGGIDENDLIDDRTMKFLQRNEDREEDDEDDDTYLLVGE